MGGLASEQMGRNWTVFDILGNSPRRILLFSYAYKISRGLTRCAPLIHQITRFNLTGLTVGRISIPDGICMSAYRTYIMICFGCLIPIEAGMFMWFTFAQELNFLCLLVALVLMSVSAFRNCACQISVAGLNPLLIL